MTKDSFEVSDDSDDKKYFTMIPNYIVNHSTVYEQAIYLYMKRKAGENGTCWVSAKTIAEKLGCSRNAVFKYREKLVERGWIQRIGQRGTTKPTDEFKIVDLWALNMEFYSKKDSSPSEQSNKEPKKKVHQVNIESSPGVTKEEPIKKNQRILATQSVAKDSLVKSIEIERFLRLFRVFGVRYEHLRDNKTERRAAADLLDRHPYEWWAQFLPDYSVRMRTDVYCPRATRPHKLLTKWAEIEAYASAVQVDARRKTVTKGRGFV